MKKYYVTPFAGAYVAGLASPGTGQPLMLTEKQAEHELRLGSISAEPPVAADESAQGNKGGKPKE